MIQEKPFAEGQEVLYKMEKAEITDVDNTNTDEILLQIEFSDGGTLWVQEWQVEHADCDGDAFNRMANDTANDHLSEAERAWMNS